MNVRNVFLMSMMVCAVPVVCVAPEVSLTKQEQAIIKKWVQESNIKNQHTLTQQVGKFIITSLKNFFLSALEKMTLGKSKVEFNSEMVSEMQILESKFTSEYPRLVERVIKDLRITKRQANVIAEQTTQFMKVFKFPLNKIITDEDVEGCASGEVIAEVNIATMKKIIAIYSFILKCLHA